MSRYEIRDGSQSYHCCFDATVIDMNKPEMIGGKQWQDSDGNLQYQSVCECFDMEDAQLICDALNAYQPQDKANGS